MENKTEMIRYKIGHILRQQKVVGEKPADSIKLAKLQAQLEIAQRRELKRLAKVLTYKADVYGPEGRIHSHEAKWTVRNDMGGKACLYHGDMAYLADELSDGHGRTITTDSMY